MPKRSGDNENVESGKAVGAAAGRRDRKEPKAARASKRVMQTAHTEGPPLDKPSVASSGAGTETLRRAMQRRAEKERKQQEAQLERETVERVIEAQVPTPPPERLLPPATRSTEINDIVREVRTDIEVTGRALRDLYVALSSLLRTPVRVFRILRPA